MRANDFIIESTYSEHEDQIRDFIEWCVKKLKITDPHVIAVSGESTHRILSYTGNDADYVEGTMFDITQAELIQADKYEVSDYKRISVKLASGIDAWVYVRT